MKQKPRTILERSSNKLLKVLMTKVEAIYNFIHNQNQRKWGYILQEYTYQIS